MASKNYVYSTLACDQLYTVWTPIDPVTKTGPNHAGEVFIRGGAGVANSKTLITPSGVATEVTDEQLALLERCEDFRRHKENGYIRVEARSKDLDKVVADMADSDKSRPYTPKSKEFNLPKIIEG